VSQLKAAWASVIPYSSFFSPSTSVGGEYPYTFFSTGSEKYGFSLKYCNTICEPQNWVRGGPETTYELQGKASPLLWVPGQPHILEKGQSDLVLVVCSVYRDSGVV